MHSLIKPLVGLQSLLAAGLVALAGQLALAQEAEDPLVRLERRIDALERENEVLRETVAQRLPTSGDESIPAQTVSDAGEMYSMDLASQASPSDAPAAPLEDPGCIRR